MAQLPIPCSNLPCGFCKNLLVSPEYFGNKDSGQLIVKRALRDWIESADLGCPLCWWILHSPHCYQRTEWSMRMNFVLAPRLKELSFEIFKSENDMLILGPKEVSSESQKLVTLKFVADEGTPAAKRIKLRPAPSVSAAGTLQKASEWLAECHNRHKSTCPEPDSSFMPLRLLDVTGSSVSPPPSSTAFGTLPDSTETDRVYLHTNVDGPVTSRSYAALTYCWGTSGAPLYTTRDNIERLTTEGIPLAELPQTIQDAVVVTRKLGLQFLWIDAFCITQDDEEEKAVEISRMAKIYCNAWVTISAAAASRVQDGFLGEREMWSGERLAPIYLPYKISEDEEIGTVGLLHNIMTPLRFQDPIHLRAWTMQETLLSTRVLVFSKQQMYFACLADLNIQTIGGNPTAINRLRCPLKITSKKSRGTKWNDIISEYSARGLSFPGDKLLALSSVASMYGKPEDYLAGLWRDELPYNLWWKPKGEADNCRRNRDGQAPSWSWMSIDGPVNPADENMNIVGRLRTTIKDCQTTPKHAFNQFGLVMDAQLLIQGVLTNIALDPKTRMIYHSENGHKIPTDPEQVIGEGSFDSLDDRNATEQAAALTADKRAILAALPIFVVQKLDARTTRPIGTAVVGFILEIGPNEAWHKRIGTFESLSSTKVDFCQDASPIREFDISADIDYSHHRIDPSTIPHHATTDEVVHQGVKCNRYLCRQKPRSSSYKGITGPRYWCLECKASYCQWCKNDPDIHYRDLCDAEQSLHRYARLPLPVRESFFTAQDWRSHGVEVVYPKKDVRII